MVKTEARSLIGPLLTADTSLLQPVFIVRKILSLILSLLLKDTSVIRTLSYTSLVSVLMRFDVTLRVSVTYYVSKDK